MTTIDLFLFDSRKFTYTELVDILKISEKGEKTLQKFACEEVKKEKLVSLFYKEQFASNYSIDANGKPVSPNLQFNVSHSKGVVVFAMNKSRPIGVDIEEIRPIEDNLKRYISTDEEYQLIDNDESFFKVWTSKESLSKCIGIGIKGQPKNIPSIPFNGVKNVDGKTYRSKTIRFDNFVGSITLEGEQDFQIRVHKEAFI